MQRYLIVWVSLTSLLWGDEQQTIDSSVVPNWVNITTYAASGDKNGITILGKNIGFIIDPDGFIVSSCNFLINPDTNYLAEKIEVELNSQQQGAQITVPAEVVGVEPTLNLSILKIEHDAALTPCTIAPRQQISLGQRIFAVDTLSKDGGATYASGTITRLNEKDCYQESMLAALFMADLTLTKEGIGGPVFNATGEVVGIYTGYEDIDDDSSEAHLQHSYFLPIFLVFNIYDSIKYKKSFKSPWTGFSVKPLTEQEASIFPTEQGYAGGIGIDHVWASSPAENLGITEEDILFRFGYYPILSVADFQKRLYQYGVGHTVVLSFIRNGEIITLEYQIEERPAWAVPK